MQETTSQDFDERAYLLIYRDVAAAVQRGEIASGRAHYEAFGGDVRVPSLQAGRLCVFCGLRVHAWLPYQRGIDNAPAVLTKAAIVGSNFDRFFCPHCNSFDRERHLWLYWHALGIFDLLPQASILHMGPDADFIPLIDSFQPSLYVLGDLEKLIPRMDLIDMQAIPYPDATFDIVIANHMLEHVENLSLALSETHRVLKLGGRFICQTPYAAKLSRTFEDPLLTSEEDRSFFYGQHDHVRLFGLDLEDKIRSAGFKGRWVAHDELLPHIDAEALGVNEHEPFFDFVRA